MDKSYSTSFIKPKSPVHKMVGGGLGAKTLKGNWLRLISNSGKSNLKDL